MTIKLVAFDLDDCLFDSTGLSERAREKGIEKMVKMGLQIDIKEALKILDQIVKEYGSNFEKHYDFFLRRLEEVYPKTELIKENKHKLISGAIISYHEEKINSIKLYDDVIPCLEKLKILGIKCAIISDGIPIKQYEKILRLNLDNYMDYIIISDEIGIRKPNPMLFEYALGKFGIKGKESIYVGDRLDKDIEPASQNNIRTVYIHRGGKYDVDENKDLNTQTKIKPDYEIYDLKELFKIIESI
ncbi:MAG: TIGR02253 family HAD-type hydrolase [Candidatus Lokiarchaeota archaeon]